MTSKAKIDLEVGKLDDLIVDYIEQHHLRKFDTTRFKRQLVGFIKMSPLPKEDKSRRVTLGFEGSLENRVGSHLTELVSLVQDFRESRGVPLDGIDEFEVQTMNYTGDYYDYMNHKLKEQFINVEKTEVFAGWWGYTDSLYEVKGNSSLDDMYIFFCNYDEYFSHHNISVYNMGRVVHELMTEGEIKV